MQRVAEHPVRLGAWRREAAARLKPQARMVLDLIPPVGWTADFLTPSGSGPPEELIERVRATPRSELRIGLERIAEHRTLPPWTRHLADDPRMLRLLGDSVQHVYECLLRPHWRQNAAMATADGASRSRHLLTGGLESLLAQVNPRWVRWKPPILEVTMASGIDEDLYLEGRGLLLMPTVFGSGPSGVVPNAEPQPLLIYPVHAGHDASPAAFPSALLGSQPAASRSLASLLGPTRAAVLMVVANRPGCSTKELAAAVGVAPASASEHATTLRTAGLLHTIRRGNTAAHSATAAGHVLLEASST
ncbi:ArsR/SmtB family transcription factor [Streptomyces sp. NPDC001480]|uniref:ArsR/SmtB family transcription factor n=1 Tax=Streptomyces sp. NPDC001480 TaxID=3364577 RepID=UPI003683B26C